MANTIYILTGSTASGKSTLALDWAQRNDAEILSCDASLFYCGMDIGTAKPSLTERAQIPHHGIDLVPVREQYDIARYQQYARTTVDAIFARGKRVLVVGGSGFYLKCFFAPVIDDLHIPPELRREIAIQLKTDGLHALVKSLHALNPAGLGNLDTHNPVRVTRALERCRTSGKSLQELHRDFAQRPSRFQDYRVCIKVLEPSPADLQKSIEKRTRAMLAAGLVEEVRALLPQGLLENPSAARAIGYAQTLEWLKQTPPTRQESLLESILIATRQLAKKQRTWFRHQIPASLERW